MNLKYPNGLRLKVNDYVVVVRKLSIGDADELKRLGDRHF